MASNAPDRPLIALTPWHRTLDTRVHPENDRYTLDAEDGIIEAIEHESGRLLAVQWHPEERTHEGHHVLFDWLVDSARRQIRSSGAAR